MRPTKKQKETLEYIAAFITEYGYSPSYREIMKALNYTSVATVSLHVNNLIKRGQLTKRNRSARSLEVVRGNLDTTKLITNQASVSDAKWLSDRMDYIFNNVEESSLINELDLKNLEILILSLNILGLDQLALQFNKRLNKLKSSS